MTIAARTGMVGLALAIAGCGLLAVQAAPDHSPAPPSKLAFAKPVTGSFDATCSAGAAVADARPDPAWVSQSFARDGCTAPVMPARINGATATREQVVAAMAARSRYEAAADAYQRCITDFVAARTQAPGAVTPARTLSLTLIENHRIAVSQQGKDRVAAQTRLAINQFNALGSDCPE